MVATEEQMAEARKGVFSFSPLFIAAMVATEPAETALTPKTAFSPLFIAAMVATANALGCGTRIRYFQSAFHRGNGCYYFPYEKIEAAMDTFSPLFIAAMVATQWRRREYRKRLSPFSPLFIAAMVATDLAISSRNSSKRRNHQRLYIIRVILTHRRCPVNFKRHKL